MTLTQEARDAAANAKGHPPAAEKIAAVDFDGTIKPWAGGLFGFPEPIPGAVEAVRKLKDAGYTIYIFTSRLSSFWHEHEGWDHHEATEKQVAYITEYCNKYEVPADYVTAEKLPAELYLDDKALQVDASHSILSQVETFLSTGLFWLKPSNTRRGARWHRVLEKPVRRERIGFGNKTFYDWVGSAACGQELYGLREEKYEDLFTERKYSSRLSTRRDTEQGYCLHCVRADKKREASVQ